MWASEAGRANADASARRAGAPAASQGTYSIPRHPQHPKAPAASKSTHSIPRHPQYPKAPAASQSTGATLTAEWALQQPEAGLAVAARTHLIRGSLGPGASGSMHSSVYSAPCLPAKATAGALLVSRISICRGSETRWVQAREAATADACVARRCPQLMHFRDYCSSAEPLSIGCLPVSGRDTGPVREPNAATIGTHLNAEVQRLVPKGHIQSSRGLKARQNILLEYCTGSVCGHKDFRWLPPVLSSVNTRNLTRASAATYNACTAWGSGARKGRP